MKLVQYREGAIEIRWTWFPFWIAANPGLKSDIERQLRDAILVNGVTPTEQDLAAMHKYTVDAIAKAFPAFQGLASYLDAIQQIHE